MVTSRSHLALAAFACATCLAGAAACKHPTARSHSPTPDAIAPVEHLSLYTSVPEPAGDRCRWGGVKTGTGPDLNGNGVLERQEVATITYACASRRTSRPALAAGRR